MNKTELQSVSEDIIKMAVVDQKVLKEGDKIEIDRVISEHSAQIRKIVDEYGLITISEFGKEASFNAWLLVQHAIRIFPEEYLDFGKRYLKMMKENKEDINTKNIAYLEDIILITQNKPQKYGTQLKKVNGRLKPYPVQNEREVDKLRKNFGLESLEQYLKSSKDFYKKTKD